MRPYLIKIDRKSIKANPDAGDTKFLDCITTTANISIRGKHDSIEFMDDRIRMFGTSSHMTAGEKFHQQTYYMVGGMNFDELNMLLDALVTAFPKGAVHYQCHNSYQEIDFIHPVPAYSYEYKPTKVKCRYCKSKFEHTELIDGEEYNGFTGEYDSITNACPECGRGHCCEVEYESFQSIVLKKAGLPAMVIK